MRPFACYSLTFLFLCLSFTLAGQDLFTVRAGVFKDVRAKDFSGIYDLGFVYAIPGEERESEVFVGQYSTVGKANEVSGTLRGRGFANAQTFRLPAEAGRQVYAIQIALRGNNRPVDWQEFIQSGDLFVESVDGTLKIISGTYADVASATEQLPRIRALGFKDAFVRNVNSSRLVPVGVFETGIKQPLIPINLQTTPGATATTPRPASPSTTAPAAAPNSDQTSAPRGYGSTTLPGSSASRATVPAAADPPVLPAAADAGPVALPAINPRAKRSSSAELQRVLKEKGYYEGSIDGLYGNGTAGAYRRAWNDMPEIRKYRLLTGAALAPTDPSTAAVSQWPEIAVTLAIVDDLAAGTTNVQRARGLAQQRTELFTAAAPLANTAATRARGWSATVWDNLNEWAAEDPLHARIISALRVSYHQSHVRLEEHYQAKGLDAIAARDLATAMLQNLTGAQLDRFL